MMIRARSLLISVSYYLLRERASGADLTPINNVTNVFSFLAIAPIKYLVMAVKRQNSNC